MEETQVLPIFGLRCTYHLIVDYLHRMELQLLNLLHVLLRSGDLGDGDGEGVLNLIWDPLLTKLLRVYLEWLIGGLFGSTWGRKEVI